MYSSIANLMKASHPLNNNSAITPKNGSAKIQLEIKGARPHNF